MEPFYPSRGTKLFVSWDKFIRFVERYLRLDFRIDSLAYMRNSLSSCNRILKLAQKNEKILRSLAPHKKSPNGFSFNCIYLLPKTIHFYLIIFYTYRKSILHLLPFYT